MEKELIYKGKKYKSIKDFTNKFHLPYQQTVNKLNDGQSLEMIIHGITPKQGKINERNIRVSYLGRKYNSLREFCIENNLKYNRIYKFVNSGLTIEQIVEQNQIELILNKEQFFNNQTTNGQFTLKKMTEGTKKLFFTNPFVLLGISSTSSSNDALDVLDKLKKLERLNALNNYKSKFDISFIEAPKRSIGKLQTIIKDTYLLENRWFAFKNSDYPSINFVNNDLFDNSNICNYDCLLYQYYIALVADPLFYDTKVWSDFFKSIDYILDDNFDLLNFLLEHIDDESKKKCNDKMIVDNFKQNIFIPLLMNIDNLNTTGWLNLSLTFGKDKIKM